MVDICLYFQVHQPYRIKRFTVFDIHKQENFDYFDKEKNKDIMERVGRKCYLPMNKLIKRLIDRTHGRFKCTYSISGTALDQMEQFSPAVLHSFQDLMRTGNIELLAETYYHSLSFLFDENEYKNQIKQHKEKIFKLFNQLPYIFRNTELIYSNRIAQIVHELGFKGMLLEGWDSFLEYHQVNGVNKSSQNNLKLLARNYRLSDDIAFRFSNKEWKEWPLTVDKFLKWIKEHEGSGEVINLFMDYETFGEHQWEDCGIFEFMEHFCYGIFYLMETLLPLPKLLLNIQLGMKLM